ncbi:hypothetical protein Q8F55_004496 [Vanrija albida]|uniref:Zn(2)-C6 fungal-type domain-containing protein n=1 Tax=Vanrija albida TaxID=181172 RepID=A0ABR3Q6W1_9TREE
MPKDTTTTDSTSPPATQQPQKRSSKACETCRVRRIRCVGPPPCEACREAGLGHQCTVRLKARPKRALSAKLALAHALPVPATVSELQPTNRYHANYPASQAPAYLSPAASKLTPPSNGAVPATPTSADSARSDGLVLYERHNPLEDIEAMLGRWCDQKNLPIASLVFKVDSRVTHLPGTPLPPPPIIEQFEDSLMDGFVVSSEFMQIDHLNIDRTWLLSLYGRYRTLPNSLTDDQTALIYATLCVSRFSQIRASMNNGTNEPTREDLTYFHLACNALGAWGRPSTTALRALLCLSPFAFGVGGPAETRTVLSQLAWQVKELGLHHRSTATLYQPQEQASTLFSAYFYADLFRASLTDLRPCLPLIDIDVDPTPPVTLMNEVRSRPSVFTARYLADYADRTIDITNMEYVTATEAMWMPHLRELRHNKEIDSPRFKIAWAEFRYNWLRVLLYTPHLANPQTAPLAYATIARAVTQTLYTYAELISTHQLHPSWPQVQRLVVCGQLLILCHEAGEFHVHEAPKLFQMLVDALDKHEPTWPVCGELAAGFSAAARVYEIEVATPSAGTAVFPEPLVSDTEGGAQVDFTGGTAAGPFLWNDLGLDFDFSSFPV